QFRPFIAGGLRRYRPARRLGSVHGVRVAMASGGCALYRADGQAGPATGSRQATRREREFFMRRILMVAAAVGLALGAALFAAGAQQKLKVGFIYVGPVGDMGWTYQHEVGRRAISEQFKDKIDTTYLENVNE